MEAEVDGHVQGRFRCDVTYSQKPENMERGNWLIGVHGVMAMVGLGVGVHTFWNTPYYVMVYGPAYIVAYSVLLVLVGVPLVYYSLAMGQFTSQGVLTCWPIPIFKGLGVAMLAYGVPLALLWNVYNSWSLYYLHFYVRSSVTTAPLPWTSREQVVRLAPACEDLHLWKSTTYPVVANCSQIHGGGIYPENGVCWGDRIDGDQKEKIFRGIYDMDLALRTNQQKCANHRQLFDDRSSLDVFFKCHVTGSQVGVDGSSVFNGPMAASLLVVWLLVLMATVFGVRTIGVVSMVTVPFASVLLVMLCVRALTLEGSFNGVFSDRYHSSVISTLADPGLWNMAAQSVLTSLALGLGYITTYASYNRFHNSFVRDVLLLCGGNFVTTVLFSLTVSGFLGFYCHVKGVNLSDLNMMGDHLLYVILPEALRLASADGTWCGLFYTVLLFFPINIVIAQVETTVTVVVDQFPRQRRYRAIWTVVLCVICYVISLPMCASSGHHLTKALPLAPKLASIVVIVLLVACFAMYSAVTYFRFRHEVAAMISWDLWCLPSIVCFVVVTSLLLTVGAGIVVLLLMPGSLSGAGPDSDTPPLGEVLIAFPVIVMVIFVIGHVVMTIVYWKEPATSLYRPCWTPYLKKHTILVQQYSSFNRYSTQIYRQ